MTVAEFIDSNLPNLGWSEPTPVTVFTLLPYSFGVPIGFQPIFSLIHYAYPFLHSHATYVDDTCYSKE
jgi:hypothetical protein